MDKALTLQERILNCYKTGASDVEVASLLEISLKKFNQMYDENSDFARVIDFGRTAAHAWWMSQGRIHLLTKGFQGSLWGFNMKNRYSWADKVDTGERESDIPQDVNQVEAELRRTLARINKSNPELVRDALQVANE